ncbi:MAG: hypothetical protein JSV36_15700, partial [Anaerolineae bacterium]
MLDLNAVQQFAEIDKQGMLAHVLNLPQTCAAAWDLAQHTYSTMDLSRLMGHDRAGFKQIVILGIGGSAIGGDLLAALVADECP